MRSIITQKFLRATVYAYDIFVKSSVGRTRVCSCRRYQMYELRKLINYGQDVLVAMN